MSDKCGNCGAQLPDDTEYPDYCCDTPSAAARAECGCGGWQQPVCQECRDREKAVRMACNMSKEFRQEGYKSAAEIYECIEELHWCPGDFDFACYAIKTYRAAKAYIETVDRLFPEVKNEN